MNINGLAATASRVDLERLVASASLGSEVAEIRRQRRAVRRQRALHGLARVGRALAGVDNGEVVGVGTLAPPRPRMSSPDHSIMPRRYVQ